MFKKLFLSIIILSALASEGGAYFSADFIDYYLANFARLDIIQNSSVSSQSAETESISRSKGTPVAFYKVISQYAIDSKNDNTHSFPGYSAIVPLSAGLAFIVVFYFVYIIKLSLNSRRSFLSLTDSSPPVFC